jgi:coenzyme F420 hydrogenase subunit beta
MFNDFQPHQVRKKHAAAARLAGMEEAGLPTIETRNLRLDVLGQALDAEARAAQIQGIRDRVTRGKITEDFPQ